MKYSILETNFLLPFTKSRIYCINITFGYHFVNKQISYQYEIYQIIRKNRPSSDLLNVKSWADHKMHFTQYFMPVLYFNNTKLIKCLNSNITNGIINAERPFIQGNNNQVNKVIQNGYFKC